ncbi:BRCA1 C Terminus (BRCT) domain [Trypanosoma vivax]|uniref:BRCT domain-containing protein n=1 Tax=Trypanosoma vivax (strain Y486) TaxID=1055687 RepID=G0U6X1_TRYVY|nr:hypothetical protein TRVL_02809 [Trypanosoma vivax]KAH8611740.1 BRCA1 C Terminus (BRCT) domain [Trypanosoma vivax]CCC51627.1 conserved hypothetical protein [Trypanosoma vivax Y486]
MHALFSNHVFIAAPEVPQEVKCIVVACGGSVVCCLTPEVTHGLVVGQQQDCASCVAQLRGLRLPVLCTSWVRASVAAGRALPMKPPHVVFDPLVFESLHFTTTMVPRSVRRRVAAVVQFFGGTYSPHLTTSTNVIVRGGAERIGEDEISAPGKIPGSGKDDTCIEGVEYAATGFPGHSAKLVEATRRAIPCVTVSWLQECINTSRLVPRS